MYLSLLAINCCGHWHLSHMAITVNHHFQASLSETAMSVWIVAAVEAEFFTTEQVYKILSTVRIRKKMADWTAVCWNNKNVNTWATTSSLFNADKFSNIQLKWKASKLEINLFTLVVFKHILKKSIHNKFGILASSGTCLVPTRRIYHKYILVKEFFRNSFVNI